MIPKPDKDLTQTQRCSCNTKAPLLTLFRANETFKAPFFNLPLFDSFWN